MMYEYAPVFAKKKEKLLTYGFLGLGLLLFATSWIPSIPYPALFQLFGVFALAAMILLFSLCLSKRYVYAVEEKEDGMPDFVITEYYGRRVTVVCRVSVHSVHAAIPWKQETRRQLTEFKKGKQYFCYTGVLFDEEQYGLLIEENGMSLLVRICSDEGLIRCLTEH